MSTKNDNSNKKGCNFVSLYNGLKYDEDVTLVFSESLVCYSAQGLCGFMTRQNKSRKGSDSAYGSSDDDRSPRCRKTCARTKPHARDLIVNTDGNRAFFKFSPKPEMHTLGMTEWIVAKSMMKRCPHIPNFMRPFTFALNTKLINHFCDESENKRKKRSFTMSPDDDSVRVKRRKIVVKNGTKSYLDKSINPFLAYLNSNEYVDDDDLVVADVAVFEVIHGETLRTASRRMCVEQLNSVTYQIMMALLMAQQANGFVHNDLHWDNIIVSKCNPNQHILYKYKMANSDEIFQRVVPTHGYVPVIIDYGFAYCDEFVRENHNMEAVYADHIGYCTYETDTCVDVVRTLIEYNSKYRLPSNVSKLLGAIPMEDGLISLGEHYSFEVFENVFNSGLKTNGIIDSDMRSRMVSCVKRCIRMPIGKAHSVSPLVVMDIDTAMTEFVNSWRKIRISDAYTTAVFIRDAADCVRNYIPDINEDVEAKFRRIVVEPMCSKYRQFRSDAIYEFMQSLYSLERHASSSMYHYVTQLRAKRASVWRDIKSGERLFMMVEKFLYDNCHPYQNIDDKLLIINSELRTFRQTTIRDYLEADHDYDLAKVNYKSNNKIC